IFVAQQPVGDPASILTEVRKIESMGGGIFIYEALEAAAAQIIHAPQANKHILLFADANDSEHELNYKDLMACLTKAGTSVSLLGLGTEQDKDAELLKDIAARGKGTIYFTEDAAQLTQFFPADTLTYPRNSYVTEPAPVQVRPAARALA